MTEINVPVVVWSARTPTEWAKPPDEMSVSSLAAIESCPRRWALESAHYKTLWTRSGYPPKLNLVSLRGTVIHEIVETVTRALAAAGCSSLQDPSTVRVMKDLGGYTKVLNDTIEHVSMRMHDNPRASSVLEVTMRRLRGEAADMRSEAQILLSRLRLRTRGRLQSTERGRDPRRQRRGPLGAGSYPEVDLRAPGIGWKGKADLLILSGEAECHIIDFKTGGRDGAHGFQLRVYALLWSRDLEQNPEARRATRLVLSYVTGDQEVEPPSSAELDTLEDELVARREAALETLRRRLPEARPSCDTCRYCGVRQLCDAYWQPVTMRAMVDPSSGDSSPFMDIEVVIGSRHGPTSWDATVTLSKGPPSGSAALVRTGTSGPTFSKGDKIRLLDVCVAIDDDDRQPAVVTMTAMSEAFRVPHLPTEAGDPSDGAH